MLLRLACLGLLAVAATPDAARGQAASAEGQALIQAAERGDVAALDRLIAAGAALEARDGRGRTALLAATHANQVEAARRLMAAGADVNAKDAIQDSPFLYAGAEGRLEILRLTLAHGADLGSVNRFGGTALIPAAHHGHVDTVRLLLATKIAVDHVNRLGWTALLETVILGDGGPRHVEILKLLLESGADPRIADRDGTAALEHARRRGYAAMAALLSAAAGQR